LGRQDQQKTKKNTCSLEKVKSQKCGPGRIPQKKKQERKGKREETKEHLFGETK
jgi:hypothetical protein